MKFRFVILLCVGALGLLLFWAAQQSKQPLASSSKMSVATSFYPLFYFTSQLTGNLAEVVNITPAGAEPHDYELTPGDRATIENSAILVINGGKLEPWGDKIRDNLSGERTKVVAVGEGLASERVDEGGSGIQDPHVWLAPTLAKREVAQIADALVSVDPGNAAVFRQNEVFLKQKLDDLDEKFRIGLARCRSKDIITSHAAFGYLAHAYGLNQVAISGLSPDEEPSPQTLARISEFAHTHNVKFIFFESLLSPRLSDTIAREVGAETLVLSPLEGLAAGDIKAGKNYFTEMENNLHNLRIALECQ